MAEDGAVRGTVVRSDGGDGKAVVRVLGSVCW